MYNIYLLQTNGKGIEMNRSELTAAFRSIGISQGTELEVHSSLSSFGHVDGGAETVIAALEECVGESGSIFMPALRLSPELPLTEEDKRLGISVKIKLFKNPLCPLIEIRVACRNLATPVIIKSKFLKLCRKCLYILLCKSVRVMSGRNRILLCRKSK